MQIQLTIKGQAVSLNESEAVEVLQALEHSFQGGSAKTFGCCTAQCLSGGGKPSGIETFGSKPEGTIQYTQTNC